MHSRKHINEMITVIHLACGACTYCKESCLKQVPVMIRRIASSTKPVKNHYNIKKGYYPVCNIRTYKTHGDPYLLTYLLRADDVMRMVQEHKQ